MDEILSLAQKLSGVSFGVLLGLILAASYYNKWQWTYSVDSRIAEIKRVYDERIAELKQDVKDWKAIADGFSKAANTATEKIPPPQNPPPRSVQLP